MTRPPNGTIDVLFERSSILSTNSLQTIHTHVLEHIFADDIRASDFTKVRNHRSYLRSICDGPSHRSEDHVLRADLVTSGGCQLPKDEAWEDINSLPLSAWTLKEMILGCRHLFNLQANTTKIIYDLSDGNIRSAIAIAKGEDLDYTLMKRRYDSQARRKSGSMEVGC